jgi:hypothetical protein
MASTCAQHEIWPEVAVNTMKYHFAGVGNMIISLGCAYAFCVILLDKMCSLIHIHTNRTLHASALARAPGGSFFAQITAMAALK